MSLKSKLEQAFLEKMPFALPEPITLQSVAESFEVVAPFKEVKKEEKKAFKPAAEKKEEVVKKVSEPVAPQVSNFAEVAKANTIFEESSALKIS